jgi:uncharacterized membrane protein YjjB (DUF3815 family)
MVADILSDAFLAAVAGTGFGAVSRPPRRAFPFIALLSGVGHALRFCLMTLLGVDLATASFFAALFIGLGSLVFGGKIHCPMTVLYIPALLPMIPGMYAYRSIFALVMLMQQFNDPVLAAQYLERMLMNATVTVSVVFLLSLGATLPTFLFPRRAYSLTRKRPSGN